MNKLHIHIHIIACTQFPYDIIICSHTCTKKFLICALNLFFLCGGFLVCLVYEPGDQTY